LGFEVYIFIYVVGTAVIVMPVFQYFFCQFLKGCSQQALEQMWVESIWLPLWWVSEPQFVSLITCSQ